MEAVTDQYIICDHLRLADLQRMDTSADTPAQAQAAAMQAEQIAAAAGAAKSLGQTPTEGDNALTRMMGLAA